MPALGVLYLASVLEKEGIPVKVVPADVLGLSWEAIEEEIAAYKPDVIGVTTLTENRFQSFELVKRAKGVLPEALVCIGGPHGTNSADDCLRHIPELDLVVRGEGEETILELMACLAHKGDLERIRGISYRKDGQILHNPNRPLIRNLDRIPMPARHVVPWERYRFTVQVPGKGDLPAANLMTSRGCPFSCNFCATPGNWGRHVRMISPERVLREIEHVMDRYGARVIWFYDDTFNASPKRVDRICDLILERGLNINWLCEARVDLLEKPLLEKMVRAGLFYLLFGVESGSERIRREVVTKKFDLEKARKTVDWCNELGIMANAFFIFSHPTETWEDAQETIRIIEEFRDKARINIGIMHVYPGTQLESTARINGCLPEDFSWSVPDRRVVTLPIAQGDVPLFMDKLTWAQISELLFRWSFAADTKYNRVLRILPQVIRDIRSWEGFKRYMIMFAVYVKLRIFRLLRVKD